MVSWWDIRGWSRRDGLMLLVALVLTLFVGYLIRANHAASLRQRGAIESQAQNDTELHALVLEHFIAEHRGTVEDLAASPEVNAYFENRALGMSPEYGLRQSLVVIAERFEGLRQRKRLGETAVFSHLRLYVKEGGILAESPAKPMVAAGGVPPPVGVGLSAGRRQLSLGAPVMFRGAEAGRVEAVIELPLLRRLLGPEVGSERSATLLLEARDLQVLLGDGSIRELPAPALPLIRQERGKALATFDDDDHHHLVITVPVAGTPFLVALIRGSDRVLGSEPWHALVLMVLLSMVLLGGSVALVLHMVRSRQLGARVTELEVKGELESARNREDLGREIQARKRAEEQRAQLGYAVEQAAEAIIITDVQGIIEYVNPAFTAITGWSRDEAVGKTPRLLKSGMHQVDFYEALWRDLLAGRPWSGRLINRHRNGELFYEDATISPVRDESGRIVRFVAVKRDVTNVIRMEEQLRQAQKLESIGQLAAGVAHEINTPIQFIGDNLRFISGGVEDLNRVLQAVQAATGAGDASAARHVVEAADLVYLGQELPKALSQSLEGVVQVAEIVRSMKEFSHPGAQQVAPSDLNRAVENTVTISRSEWRQVAEVRLRLDPVLPPVPLLLGEFNQVLLNLIINAAHAIADKHKQHTASALGHIDITTMREGGMVRIQVADDGIGMSEAVQARIFEPFFTTKEVGRGMGQGLAMARSMILKKLHGSIAFESRAGVGTTFTITLPCDQPPA